MAVDATRHNVAGPRCAVHIDLSRQMDGHLVISKLVSEQQALLVVCRCGDNDRRIVDGAGVPHRAQWRQTQAPTDEQQRRRRSFPDEVPADRSAHLDRVANKHVVDEERRHLPTAEPLGRDLGVLVER